MSEFLIPLSGRGCYGTRRVFRVDGDNTRQWRIRKRDRRLRTLEGAPELGMYSNIGPEVSRTRVLVESTGSSTHHDASPYEPGVEGRRNIEVLGEG